MLKVKDMLSTGRTLGSIGGKRFHFIFWCIYLIFAVLGEKQQTKVLCDTWKAIYSTHWGFPNRGSSMIKMSPFGFLSPLESLWLNKQRKQEEISTTPFSMVPLSDTHMNSSPHFTLLHLCPKYTIYHAASYSRRGLSAFTLNCSHQLSRCMCS